MTLEKSDSKQAFIAKSTTPPDAAWPERRAIERIEAISQNARTTWFGLLGLLAFVMVTLLGVEDIDFFGYGRETQLPLIGVSVPTFTFFVAAPILTAAVYAYFHFYLMKLWDALGRAPARISGAQPRQKRAWTAPDDALGDRIHPWLVSDAALLLRRKEGAAPKRALSLISAITSGALTWGFGWIALFEAWRRSLPAHDEWLSLLILGCFVFSLWVGLTSLVIVWRRVGQRRFEDGSHYVWRRWFVWIPAWAVVFVGAAYTWAKTEGGFEQYAIMYSDWRQGDGFEFPDDRLERHDNAAPKWLATWRDGVDDPGTEYLDEAIRARADYVTPANLFEAQLTEKPSDWADREHAEIRYRRQWCTRRNLDWALCVKTPDDRQAALRQIWCAEDAPNGAPKLDAEACAAHFADHERRFQAEWSTRRDDYLSILKKPNLEGKDLRFANLQSAFLPKVDLEGARLERANLIFARLEGANLSGARLEGALLFDARLEGANITFARLEGANLIAARLEGAELNGARLEGAYLSGAKLEGADLSGAKLEGADLRGARLEGADLSSTRLEGADLREAWLEEADLSRARLEGVDLSLAQLQSAEFSGAVFGPSPLNSADFTGAQNLTQEMLQQAVGDAETILPNLDGPPLYVWSCWEKPPASFDQLLSHWPSSAHSDLRDLWLCGRHGPIKTGRTAAP